MMYSGMPDEKLGTPFPFEANLATGFCRFTDMNMEWARRSRPREQGPSLGSDRRDRLLTTEVTIGRTRPDRDRRRRPRRQAPPRRAPTQKYGNGRRRRSEVRCDADGESWRPLLQ